MSDYILEDDLVQILKHLPVKTLLQFRCVCKRWKETIDSAFFIQEHLAVQKPCLIAEYDDQCEILVIDPRIQPLVKTIKDPLWNHGVGFVLFGTLHGIICLFDYQSDILLWNPSIRKLSTLHLPKSLELIFFYDPTDEYGEGVQTCFAFWINPSTKEFKVLLLYFYWDDDVKDDKPFLDGLLYSSVRHDWRVIPIDGMWDWNWKSCQPGPPLFIGGVAYWRGHYKIYRINNKQGHVCKAKAILSFDFVNEVFELIELPDVKYLPSVRLIPYRWQSSLSLLCWDKKFPHRCDGFLGQQGSWMYVFSLNLLSPIADVFWVLADMKDRLRILAATQITHRELVLYDTKVGCIPLIGSLGYANVAYDFVESLLFPDFVNPERTSIVP